MQLLEMRNLVLELHGAFSRLELLQFDEDYGGVLGEPCSAAQIGAATQDLGRPLPPSYQAFLELHNGWTDFVGEAGLLAVEDRHTEWFRRRVMGISDHLKSFGDPDFVPQAYFLLAHPDVSTVLFLDKSCPTSGGELEVVEFCLREGELDRYPSFETYLSHRLQNVERVIAGEEG